MHAVLLRRSRHLGVILALVLGLLAIPATPAKAALVCGTNERFTGSVADMKHFLNACVPDVPFDVIDNTTAAAPALPDSGGPSCDWLASTSDGVGGPTTSLVKACYSQGVPHLVCTKWFTGNLYPYHCGPVGAARLIEFNNMVAQADAQMQEDFKACLKGAAARGIAAIIVKVSGGVVGIIANLVGGCVGGAIVRHYFG